MRISKHHNHFHHLKCRKPVGWLGTISNGGHLIHLGWSQISWKGPDLPNDVSRETINELATYFARGMITLTISSRLARYSQTHHRRFWYYHQVRVINVSPQAPQK